MVKLRLKRMGSKYNAFYRIVAADAKAPRDSKYIEELGFYNPHSKEIKINLELKDKWISRGAVPSDTVKNLFTRADKAGLVTNKVIVLPTKKVTKKQDDYLAQSATAKSDSVTTDHQTVLDNAKTPADKSDNSQ